MTSRAQTVAAAIGIFIVAAFGIRFVYAVAELVLGGHTMNPLLIILGAALIAVPLVAAFAAMARADGLRTALAAWSVSILGTGIVVAGAFLIAAGVGAL